MAQVYGMQNAPTAGEYVRALRVLGPKVTDEHRMLFRAHYYAYDRAATAKQIARWSGVASWGVVNLRYAKLGRAVCELLNIKPLRRDDGTDGWWTVWSRGWDTPGGFVWQMLPQVAHALEQMGWVDPADGFTLPDEVVDLPLVEGAVSRITVNAYERNSEARRRCIDAHGTACCICGFCFGAEYGPEAEGYIHVHHLRPLSQVGEAYTVDPEKDLRPVCPNCHAVLHLGGICRSIEDVKKLRATARRNLSDCTDSPG